jgi:hypothetical protein
LTDALLPELERLDPWAFWAMPGSDFGVDRLVVGTTGAFAIVVSDVEGYVSSNLGRIRVGGSSVASLPGLRAKARKLATKLSSIEVPGGAEAVLVLTQATVGAPRQIKGVWVVRPQDLPRLIAQRPNKVPRQTAKRAAQALGAKVSAARRDQNRGGLL